MNLEDTIEYLNAHEKIIKCNNQYCTSTAIQIVLQELDKLQKENKELNEFKKECEFRMKSSNEMIIKKGFINKNKVKNLKEEIEKEINTLSSKIMSNKNNYIKDATYCYLVQELSAINNKIEEILESEE